MNVECRKFIKEKVAEPPTCRLSLEERLHLMDKLDFSSCYKASVVASWKDKSEKENAVQLKKQSNGPAGLSYR